jgi:hypothetical protein
MNEDLNMDEFESWLKGQADKHRMYPSDQLWRNINQQLHEQQRWPALTFGAILTGAFITALLIFFHPTKDVFSYVARQQPSSSITTANQRSALPSLMAAIKPSSAISHPLQAVDVKSSIYAFNYPLVKTQKGDEIIQSDDIVVPEEEPLATAAVTIMDAPTVYQKGGSVVKSTGVSAVISHAFASESDIAGNLATSSEKSIGSNNSSAVTNKEEALEETATSGRTIRIAQAKKSRWNIEVYGGPNMNYRRLIEPQSYNYHLPYNQNLASSNQNKVNNLVKQRPSFGFNVGTSFTYSISNRMKLKAGMQFNFRQFNISAFRSSYERSVLLLNNDIFYPDSLYTYSVISNGTGHTSITLNNRYYQIGVPIGFEWTAVRLPKVDFNLAASIQPTYQLNTNNYLITSDYKSYVQAPRLLRRWNMNAGAELTANIRGGGVVWQVGPQILYQTLPTQKENYSIREHLVDYGLRIGIVKEIR